MAFPTDLTNAVDGVTEILAAHLNNLEAKIGVDGSAVVSSLDYLLKNSGSIDPGHLHSELWQSDGGGVAVDVDKYGNITMQPGWLSSKTGGTGSNKVGYWFPICNVILKAQYANSSCNFFLCKNGGAAFSSYESCQVFLRVKQQSALGNPPIVDLQIPLSCGIKNTEIVFVLTTNDANKTEGTLYIQNNTNFESFTISAFNKNRDTANSILTIIDYNTAGVAALPAGTQYAATMGVYTNNGNVGIGVTAFGNNAVNVIGMGNCTAPTTAPSDMAQLWVEDIAGTAGKAGLHMMAESGTEKLIVAGIIRKTTTGDPSQVHEGLMCINTNDNTVKIYADGGWRQLASW